MSCSGQGAAAVRVQSECLPLVEHDHMHVRVNGAADATACSTCDADGNHEERPENMLMAEGLHQAHFGNKAKQSRFPAVEPSFPQAEAVMHCMIV